MAQVQELNEPSELKMDVSIKQSKTLARILARYREYLSKVIQGSLLVDRLEGLIDAEQYQGIQGMDSEQDATTAALNLVISGMDSGNSEMFGKILNIFDEIHPKTASILRKRKDSCLDYDTVTQDIVQNNSEGSISQSYFERVKGFRKQRVSDTLLIDITRDPDIDEDEKYSNIDYDVKSVDHECQTYIQSLKRCREVGTSDVISNELLRTMNTEPYEIKYNVVFELESRPFDCLLICIIEDLKAGLHDFYDEFIRTLSEIDLLYLSRIIDKVQFAKATLKSNATRLVDLDIDSILEVIGPNQSLNEADIFGGTTREKTAAFITVVVRKLNGGDVTLFDKFMDVLAGLHPETFRILSGREPTVAEAESCIKTDIEDLKSTIIEKGHQTDKLNDSKIDLEKNYVKLRVKPSVNDGFKASPAHGQDNEHPLTYQSGLSKGDRDIEDVMESTENEHKLCLIQGRCGIGKTTMTQHMCRRWAKGKCLKKFSYLFLIQIRRLMVFKNRELSLYALLTEHSLYQNRIPFTWLKKWSHQILLNIDGLDELRRFSQKLHTTREITDLTEQALPEELLVNLLRRNLLPNATLSCTSRPFEDVAKLQCDDDFEVMGLTKEGVMEYIERNVAPENQARVKSSLGSNPVLMSVCSITYYASLLSRILARKESITAKDTETYSRLMASIIRAYPIRETDNSYDQMRCSQSFKVLAEIALHHDLQDDKESGLSKITFVLDDIHIDIPEAENSIDIAQEYGLVQITEVTFGEDCKSILEFSHLSVQEFFAAFQLLKASQAAEISIEERLSNLLASGSLDMFQIFTFAAAMDKDSKDLDYMRKSILGPSYGKAIEEKNKNIIIECFRKLLPKQRNAPNFMKACQIAYEAQSIELANHVSKWFLDKKDILSIQSASLNALDIKALAYVFGSRNLQQLRLSEVNLDSYSVGILTQCLKGNEALKSLDLSYNQIKEEGLAALSDFLEANTGLEELNLKGNSIRSSSLENLLPGLTKNRDIFGFLIGENDIGDDGAEAIALSLMNTNSLTALDVCHNNIGPRGMAALGDLIRQKEYTISLECDGNGPGDALIQNLFESQSSAKLKLLSLNDTLVTSFGATIITQNLHAMEKGCHVGLRNCQIGTKSAKVLIDVAKGRSLFIDLQGNHIDHDEVGISGNYELPQEAHGAKNKVGRIMKLFSRGKKFVAKTLSGKKMHKDLSKMEMSDSTGSLLEINISGNSRGSERIRWILDKLFSGLRFYSIDLSDCEINDVDVRLLAKVFINSSALQEVHLHGNNITDNVVKDLSCLAFTCPNLSKIDVSQTHINEESQRMFLDMSIRHHEKSLNLSGHKINDTGMKHLTELIMNRNINLRSLNVNNCSIKEGQCSHLSYGLEENKTVEELNLANNMIGSRGASDIARVIAHNSSLRSLDLGANSLGDEGGKVISAALAQNSSLVKINMRQNRIGVEGGKAIAAALSKNSSLTQIDLSFNGIEYEAGKAIADSLEQNSALYQINLSHNRIGAEGGKAIAAALSKNSSLTQIDLSYNDIDPDGGKAIADALLHNTSITHIQLSQNRMGPEVGKAIACVLAQNSSLRQIDLASNAIDAVAGEAIAAALGQNTSLAQIDIRNNELFEQGGKAIGDTLAQNHSLTQIDLSSNSIGDETGKAIAVALRQNLTLTRIDLRNNRIGEEGGKALANALAENMSITWIDLLRNNIGDKGGKAFAFALKSNSFITHINLSFNNIKGNGGKAIGDTLAQNKTLNQIDLSLNEIGEEGGKAIGQALGQNSSLTKLDLRDNGIGVEGAKVIADGLAQNSSLTEIDMCSNKIGVVGGKSIADALTRNSSLTKIDLSENGISSEGGEAIAGALTMCSALTQLNLRGNALGIAGCQAIAQALAQNSSLTQMDLSLNVLDHHSGQSMGEAIGAALAQNSTLIKINIRGNWIGDMGVKALAAALEKNISLSHINLSSNIIGDNGARAIADALAKNTSLTDVNLSSNTIGAEGGKHIAEALAQNSSLTQIDLRNNEIYDEGAKVIAATLTQESSSLIHGKSDMRVGRRSLLY